MKNYRALLTAIFLITILAAPVFAESIREDASNLLVKTAERSLEAGDIQTAIHELSKALMLNPDNEKAKFHLSKFNIDKGLYTGSRNSNSQTLELARDIRDYKEDLLAIENERFQLEKRVDLLEDVIARKGDHQLLKNVEDYYRDTAVYMADENLPKSQQLLTLKKKQRAFRKYAFYKDRVQDKTIDVMEELLDYREEHLENARNRMVTYKIALAQNRKELLHRMDHLKKLSHEFDTYRERRYYDPKELEFIQEEMKGAQKQIDSLIKQRGAVLLHLKKQVKEIKRSL